MMQFGLLRNNQDVPHTFGTYTLLPRAVGRVPYHLITHYRAHPDPTFTVVEDDPSAQIFRSARHQPSNPLYSPSRE